MQPASSGIALPDRRGAAILVWKIIAIASLIVGAVAFVSFVILMFAVAYGAGFGGAMVALVIAGVALVLGFVGLGVVYVEQTTQRTELADALTRAGHPGVDALRLQRGHPAPSPQNLELRLRKERDDSGRRWLLVDAHPYPAPIA